MTLLKIKKKEDERLKRIEELEKRIKKLGEPSEQEKIEEKLITEKPKIKPVEKIEEKVQPKKVFFSELFKPKEEPKKEEKKIIEEVHKTVKEAVKNGTIAIETTAKDIMTTDVKYVKPDDDLRKVLEILSEFKITGVPVVLNDKIVGIVSQSDIIKIMNQRGIIDPVKDVVKLSELEKLKVNDIMTKNPIVINEREKITDASDLMSRHDVERLPVVDDKKNLVGIITREDIIKGMTNEFFAKSIEASGTLIETNIDKMIEIVENRGSVTFIELSKELGITQAQVEEWATILEERGMVQIEYPPLGPPRVRRKK
jgi:CBS domain-containing protein